MKTSVALTTLAAATLALSACGGGPGADDDRPSVVASFYPFAWVAEQVGGDGVRVENLTSPGVEPHDIELEPQQVGAVQDADLVIYEHDFQAAVDDAVDLADRSADDTVDVADVVQLLPAGDEHGDHDHGDEEHGDHDHGDEEHGDEEHGDEEHGDHDHGAHDHGDIDPHTWLDPENMVAVTRAVQDALSDVDPAQASTFEANADALVAELEDLDTAFAEGLATCERRTIVTSHAAFAYLADRYDLEQEPIAGIDPSNEPSPRDLADITTLVKAEGITTIFTEELVSPAVARTVADETGADIATLDPIEGLGDATADETYLTLMRSNLDALREANSCS